MVSERGRLTRVVARSGVGKSELAKTLASYYFGSEEAMVSGCEQ
jgi:guanylate kinase